MDTEDDVICIDTSKKEPSNSALVDHDGDSAAVTTRQSHVVITIDEESMEKVESDKEEADDTYKTGSKFQAEPNEETTDSDIEILTTFEEYMAKREMVEEELKKMKALEEEQLQLFGTLKRFSLEERIYPMVKHSSFHTVAFKIKDEFHEDEELVPHPKEFEPKWSSNYVPMPCCEQNTRVARVRIRRKMSPVSGGDGTNETSTEERVVITSQVLNLWDRLKILLREPFISCDDLTSRMNQINLTHLSGNVLKYTIDNMMTVDEGYNFFCKVLPMMTELCMDLPNIVTCPLPVLKRFVNHSISLSQKQIASLLANAFFSTFPKKLEHNETFPSINLNELFSCDREDPRFFSQCHKLRCILHYFERIAEKMPNGVVTFTRKWIQTSKLPDWSKSRKYLKKLVVMSNGTIETNGTGMLQVDFANKYVGGGVLGRGAVQEEILFVIYPELLISRLFTDKLVPTETLVITGCERFSTYEGYSEILKYTGDFEDLTPKDPRGRRQTQFVAMDAYFIRIKNVQFHPKFMERELNKAFVGFSSPAPAPVAVASGKWGCGAFNGNPQLKTILQWLAASQAGRDLALFTFGDTKLQREITEASQHIQGRAVGDIWTLLNRYYDIFCITPEEPPAQTLFQYIPEHFSGRFWDGHTYVAKEEYEGKLYPVGSTPPPYDPENTAGPSWEEGQNLLSTLGSFKLTDPVEIDDADLSETGFVIDRNADPMSSSDENEDTVDSLGGKSIEQSADPEKEVHRSSESAGPPGSEETSSDANPDKLKSNVNSNSLSASSERESGVLCLDVEPSDMFVEDNEPDTKVPEPDPASFEFIKTNVESEVDMESKIGESKSEVVKAIPKPKIVRYFDKSESEGPETESGTDKANVEADSAILKQSNMELDVKPNVEPDSAILKHSNMECDAEPNVEADSAILKHINLASDANPNVEPDSSILKHSNIASDAKSNVEPESAVLKQRNIASDTELNAEADSAILKQSNMESDVELSVEADSATLKQSNMESDVEPNVERDSAILKQSNMESDLEPNVEPDSAILKQRNIELDAKPNVNHDSSTLKHINMESDVEPDLTILKQSNMESDTKPNIESDSASLKQSNIECDTELNVEPDAAILKSEDVNNEILKTNAELDPEIQPINPQSEKPDVNQKLSVAKQPGKEFEILIANAESESEIQLTNLESQFEELNAAPEVKPVTNVESVSSGMELAEPHTEESCVTSQQLLEMVVEVPVPAAVQSEPQTPADTGNCKQKEKILDKLKVILPKQSSCTSWKEWKEEVQIQESKKRKSESDSPTNVDYPTHKPKYPDPGEPEAP